MSTPSFKQMILDKTARRADAMKFRIEDIHEEPGFNLRDEHAVDADGVSFEESIAQLANYIRAGGILPPLEVRPRPEGGVFVVDGYRRRRALLQAADSIRDAAGELWIAVVPFTGNDAERTARIITSQQNRKLGPLELARGYARLVAFDWSTDQIAARVGKTRQHVDQMLILAHAPSAVQALVREGSVAATSAIGAVRQHGEEAGPVLAGAVAVAKASGKQRATVSAIKGKALPRKVVDALDAVTAEIAASLDDAAHARLAEIAPDDASATVAVPASLIRGLLAVRGTIASKRPAAAHGGADGSC
ncbi:ParB/RepB/Spo0J family partition protein [Xanthomonas sp. NCPPB 3005]|uniref:ParB/RepB/Spo0J family partition protein n=1 Tax=Xanthomonas sp. NCPPB 3005 TaxID=3240913 RepID=UPI003515D563